MLVELDDIKTYLALNTATYDDLLTLLEGVAVSFIEKYCNNKIEEAEITEYFDGKDSIVNNTFFLSNNLEVTSLIFYEKDSSDEWSEVSTDDYTLDSEKGIIYYDNDALLGYKNYKATYTCGYSVIPDDLKIAILKLIGRYYNKHKSDGITDESLDGANIKFERGLNDDITSILNKYKITVL